jgi:hypothetical protein
MRIEMGDMAFIIGVVWICSLCIQVLVLAVMTAKKQFRDFPALYVYLLVSPLQAPLMYLTYSMKGYQSWAAFWTGWGSQAVVVLLRWVAVCELCYEILGQFRGVWALAWRVLALSGGVALLLAIFLGGHDFVRIISTFDLAIEFSMATVLTIFFAFTRFYEIEILPSLRSIGVALCLYSSFRALNDAFLQKYLHSYAETWNLTDEITYIATLVLLGSAVYLLKVRTLGRIRLLPREIYGEYIPRANDRLAALNDKLRTFLKSQTQGKA